MSKDDPQAAQVAQKPVYCPAIALHARSANQREEYRDEADQVPGSKSDVAAGMDDQVFVK